MTAEKRQRSRFYNTIQQGRRTNGEVLAQTLTHYSERGLDYVKSLTGMSCLTVAGI